MPGWSGSLPEAVKRQVAWAVDEREDRDTATSIDYAAKPPLGAWVDVADPAWVVEYVETQRGRRQVSTFGGWRGKAKASSKPDRDVVEAPYAWGDAPYIRRLLPRLDPLEPAEADWVFDGHGPRWALRTVRTESGEWLVWPAR